jgi:hypothetical protein
LFLGISNGIGIPFVEGVDEISPIVEYSISGIVYNLSHIVVEGIRKSLPVGIVSEFIRSSFEFTNNRVPYP